MQFFFDDLYQGVTKFGDTCGVAVGDWQEGDDVHAVAMRVLKTEPLAMPYRSAAAEQKPKVGKNQYLYTRCVVDLTKLESGSFGWMRLHFVHGESAVFLNGTLRQTLGDLGTSEFPILTEDRRPDAELLIISRPNALKADRLGLPTAMPLFVTGSRKALARPNIGSVFDFNLRSSYWINWSLVFLFVFGVAWIGGLRSPDVGWMCVALATNAATNVALFSVENTYTPTMGVVSRVAVMATHLAFAAFAWTFVRRKSQWPAVIAFLAIVSVYAALFLTVPTYLTSTQMTLDIPAWTQMLTYGFVAIFGFGDYLRAHDKPARRSLFVLSICALMAVARGVDLLIFYTTYVTFIEALTELAMTGFAGFLVYDLVVYHRRYLQERVAHSEARIRSRELEAIAQTTQMLAHDVRKPFSSLKIALNAIASAPDAESAQRIAKELGARVERDRARTETLLRDVMEIGGDRRYECVATDLRILIDQAIEVTSGALGRPLQIELHLAATRQPLLDCERFLRVMVNLIENAAQAAPAEGMITVASEDAASARVKITVSNPGAIISRADRDHIFEPFFTKGKAGGTGLGLAIVRKVVHGHGGSIHCHSDERATVFELHMPAAEHIAVPEVMEISTAVAPIAQASTSRSTPLVLALIEDDVFVAEVWMGVLAPRILVRVFTGPEQLRLAMAAGASFDFFVVDYYFPDTAETGADLALWIKQQIPGAVVGASTDLRNEEFEVRIFDAVYGKEPPAVEALEELAERRRTPSTP